MSSQIYKIVEAVNNEIRPLLPGMTSERQRVEMRANLSALEKMCKDLRRQLLSESKNLKISRADKRAKKSATIINEQTNA